MNFSAKPTDQLPIVVHRMRRFKSELRHQMIDEPVSSDVQAPVGLPSAQRIYPCWPDTNDLPCEISPQNRVRNFGLLTYLPSRAVTVVKQHEGDNGGSAYGTLRSQRDEDALRDRSIRKQRSQSLNCAHKRFVRTAVRLTPIRNTV